MIRFSCDYAEGAHPKVLERLNETNLCQSVGYGEDPWCDQARDTIRNLCQAPEAQVQFLVGGTQVNFTLIAAALRSYQGSSPPTRATLPSTRPALWRLPATRS